MARLPTIGDDLNNWGTVLNQFLQVGHNADGSNLNSMRVYNVNDDAYAGNINTAATAAGNAGGGLVLVPPGTYTVSPITLQNRVWLMGAGMRSTVIKLANGSNDSLIKNFVSPDNIVANAEFCGVMNLMLDGNKANQSGTSHGIRFTCSPLSSQATNDDEFDIHHLVQNVFIKNALLDGFNATGRSGMQLYNVQIYSSGRNGFNPSFDTELIGCIAGNTGKEGFYLNSSSLRLTNCKSFFSGLGTASLGYGYHITGGITGVSLAACEAQDNTASGFVIDTVNCCTLVGCVADSNSTSSAGTYPGLDVYGATNCLVKGFVAYERRQDGVNSWQTHALQIRNSSTANRIELTHAGVLGGVVAAPIMTSSDSTAGNDIRINSQDAYVTTTYAASITPDPYAGSVIEVALTGALTINAPANGHPGCTLTFILKQDVTGGRVVTFNAVFKTNWTPVTTTNKTNTITFSYDGTSWWQLNATTGI